MDNSIETIWKKGFLNSDALIAPKLNNLYNQKSQNISESGPPGSHTGILSGTQALLHQFSLSS